MKTKWVPILLVGALSVSLLAGCTKTKADDKKTERTLRIATSFGYGPDDEYMRQQFTESFELMNPNIHIEIIPTNDDKFMYKAPQPGERPMDPFDKLKEVMNGPNPPDVVITGFDQLPELIQENMLAPLDTRITKDKFDTTDFVPGVLEGIKSIGDGKLYALAPTFYSNALIYNKKLFTDAGVEFPKDNMTWDQVFELARRVSKGDGNDRKYGFNFNSQSQGDLFYSLMSYTAPLQLTMYDDKAEKMTVDSDQWESVLKTVMQLNKDKITPEPPNPENEKEQYRNQEGNPFAFDDFMSGRLAMTIMSYMQLSQITNANKNAENIKGYTPIEWDAVTMPVHDGVTGVYGFTIPSLMAINVKAGNPEDAWNYIKFINGEEWAKVKSRSNNMLVTHKKYIKPREGEFNIGAFYNVTPIPPTDTFNKLMREKQGLWQVMDIGRQVFMDVQQGKKGIRDGLKEWQTKGDEFLKKLKDDPNAQWNMGKEPMPGIAG